MIMTSPLSNVTVSSNTTEYYDIIHNNGTSPATAEEQVVMATIIGVLGVWSTVGNTLTIATITTQRGMMTRCNFFIISLAISDLLSGVIASPLWLYRRTWGFHHWNWGRFLCKAFWFTDESTSYCTAMHIASFALWRLLGVKWPQTFHKVTKRHVAIYLGTLWVVALIFGGFIFSLFYDVEDKSSGSSVGRCWPMCSIRSSHNGIENHRIYYTFSSSTFMLFPMLVLILASIIIVRELIHKHPQKSKSRRKKEKKAVFQMGLISSSFLIGYVPMMLYVMWTTRTNHSDLTFSCQFDYWFHVGAFFSLRFSECINPLMYNAASSKMRNATANLLRTGLSATV